MARTAFTHPLTAALVDGGQGREDAIRTLRATLKSANGKVILAAKILGMNRQTLIRLMRAADLADYARDLRTAAGISGPRTPQAEFAGRAKVPRKKS